MTTRETAETTLTIITPEDFTTRNIIDHRGRVLATVYPPYDDDGKRLPVEPLARLIAASPTLRQFAQDVLWWLEHVSGPDAISPGNIADVVRDARTLLAKIDARPGR